MLICLEQSLSAVKLLQQLHSLGNMAVSYTSCTCYAMHATGSAIGYVSTLSADKLCTADVCSSADDGSQHLLHQELFSGRGIQTLKCGVYPKPYLRRGCDFDTLTASTANKQLTQVCASWFLLPQGGHGSRLLCALESS